MSDPPLVLASASPRRAELLRLAGFTFEVAPADVDEMPREAELAEHYVRRLAEAKARAVAAQHPGAAVLGADTTVAVDGAILGKPADSADAVAMLHRLQGRAHDVLTGVAVVGPGWSASSVATTRVWMAPLTAEDIDGYVASGEPMDKAGAYAIQGLASRFVTRIEGSYPNVVGLPVHLVHELLAAYRHARPAEAAPPTGSAAV
jgi:septum formation protein